MSTQPAGNSPETPVQLGLDAVLVVGIAVLGISLVVPEAGERVVLVPFIAGLVVAILTAIVRGVAPESESD